MNLENGFNFQIVTKGVLFWRFVYQLVIKIWIKISN